MPILTTLGLPPADDALDVEKHYTPTFGEYLKAAWDDTANDDPMTLGANLRREQEARYGVDVYEVAEEGGLTGGLEALRETAPLPAMPLEEQKAYINKEGLAGQLAPGEHYTPEELEFLARLKHEELDRKLTREQAPGWMAPFGFAAGLAESMTDPLNLATSFVPVVGEARVMSLLGKTGSAWGRAGVRAGVGAIEGAVGAALVEPVVAGAKSSLQQDYGFADSLMNVAFGAGMGAVLHPLTGAFGDFTRARKGQRQPWEYVPSTDTTEQLRAGNAQSIWRGMRESGSEHLSPEHAEAAAALWDATLRGYAYDTGELVEDLYRHYRVEYRGGKLEVLPAAAEADGRTARLAEMFKDMTDTTERTSVPDGDEDEAEPAAPDAPEAVAADAAVDGRAVEEAGAVDGMAPEEAVVSPAAPVGEEGAGVSRRALGLPTSILNGQTAEGARYELREMSDLIPSHDPERQFAKRNDYPEGVQERPYHSDSGEQEKVLRNAAGLDPRYLLNDNPDAINGPPLVTDSGVVLGGNSRTMSIQLAYSNFPERAAGYRDALRQRASLFGIDPAAVDAFERPVLVRVVEGGDNANDMAVRARLYNQSQTQGLQAQAEGVSKARLLSAESMDILAADMEGFDSLREFFASAKSKDFISALSRDGVLEHTQLSRLTDSSGKLNDAGKDLVENALRGLVVPDYDVLHATPPSVLHKLDRAIPALARLKARGEDWDMSGVVTRALRAVAAAEAEGKDISIYLGQGGLLQGGPKPAVQALALTFSKATQKEVQARFTVLADASERQNRGQTSLLVQEDNTPAREFVRAFLQPVAAVDGELFPGFAPGKNVTHEAIAYAYEHGGKTHSVAVAVEDLQKKLSSATASAEEKARARALMGELAHLSGTVNIYEPRLGNFFSYKKGDALFQGKATSLDEAQELLARDVAAWEKTVDDFMAGKISPRSSVTIMSKTPLVLSLLGADKDLRVNTDYGKLKKILQEKHKLPESVLKQLPDAMTDPVMIFDSATMAGDYVMMLGVKDGSGATVIVPVSFNYKQGRGYTVNYVPSVYSKKNLSTGIPNDRWFTRQIEEGRLRYINKRKAAQWASSSRLQLPWVGTHLNGKKRIFTEADLVNVKKQFPGNYQRAVASPENGGTVITVRGDELGVPEGADLKEYQKAAREVYRKLQKTPAQREDLGEIRFTSVGFGKMIISGADPRKWKLVPRLKELIEKADYITRRELNKKRKDDIVVFHWLEGNVDLDGERLRVGFQIGEDSKGNKFYNLNQDLEKWERRYKKTEDQRQSNSDFQKRKTPDRTDIGFGGQELFQDASASIENTITTSTDGVNLYILSEGAQGEAPRARVSFGEPDAYAVVEFFKAADPSSAPHEMYHIFRRIMSELYDDPKASEAFRDRYRKACEFVGAEPGKVWTPEQEEKFARAGERFLLEGVAPNARMHDVMEAFRQWMGEIYGNAERSGLEISDGMRKVFGDMLGTAEDGDLNFRYAMGQILDYHPERGIDTTFEAPAYSTPEHALEAYTADASARMDEAFNALADKPEVQEQFRQEYAAALADADAVIADARTMAQIRQAAAACVMRG